MYDYDCGEQEYWAAMADRDAYEQAMRAEYESAMAAEHEIDCSIEAALQFLPAEER